MVVQDQVRKAQHPSPGGVGLAAAQHRRTRAITLTRLNGMVT
jgi:hypothetical protein